MAKPEKQQGKGYREVFLTWCLPGVVLVAVGQLAGRPAFSYFGMSLLSMGVLYYGKLKKYNRVWYYAWLMLFFIYLTYGFVEMLKPAAM
jgi:hypothetical protein